ncbi:MAG: hypothetical protein KDB26_00995 [Microthrixaceae bacterium]|nr:hypothetical protein [Microthrixaceae bacterium]
MRLSRSSPPVKTAVGLIAAIVITAFGAAPTAGAGESGSTSTIVGRGDVLTTIFRNLGSGNTKKVAQSRRRVTKTKATKKKSAGTNTAAKPAAPACRDLRLTDGELEWLVAALGNHARTPFLDRLSEVLATHLLTTTPDAAPLSEVEIMVRQCGVDLVDAWAVQRLDAGDLESRLARSMLTRLPEPVLAQSPPPGSAVPVNEPVFISIPSQHWHRVDALLTVSGITAEVRAEPFGLRTYTGEPTAVFELCTGPGKPFDPTLGLSARRQATRPESCTMRYRQSSKASASSESWVGSVSVLWRVEWRVGTGDWRSLGTVPRTRVLERSVVELSTSITRIVDPSRAATR